MAAEWKIEGVGGAFVFSSDPAVLAKWYEDELGLKFDKGGPNTFYQAFLSTDLQDPERKIDTSFAIMRRKTELVDPERPDPEPTATDEQYGDQHFMVNLRTKDLDALVARLKKRGISVIASVDEGYGKFAWVRDPDGNRIELYQPTPENS